MNTCREQVQARYQAAAVSIQGEKQFYDRYLNLSATGERRAMLLFDFPLDEIDHIELRPHGGRHRFFFEAVELPKIVGSGFDPPPVLTIPVENEQRILLAEFAPLHVDFSVTSGKHIVGSRANSRKATLMQSTEVFDPDSSFTLSYIIQGFADLPLSFRFQDAGTGSVKKESEFRLRRQYRASSANSQVGSRSYDSPIEEISAVEVTVDTLP